MAVCREFYFPPNESWIEALLSADFTASTGIVLLGDRLRGLECREVTSMEQRERKQCQRLCITSRLNDYRVVITTARRRDGDSTLAVHR